MLATWNFSSVITYCILCFPFLEMSEVFVTFSHRFFFVSFYCLRSQATVMPPAQQVTPRTALLTDEDINPEQDVRIGGDNRQNDYDAKARIVASGHWAKKQEILTKLWELFEQDGIYRFLEKADNAHDGTTQWNVIDKGESLNHKLYEKIKNLRKKPHIKDAHKEALRLHQQAQQGQGNNGNDQQPQHQGGDQQQVQHPAGQQVGVVMGVGVPLVVEGAQAAGLVGLERHQPGAEAVPVEQDMQLQQQQQQQQQPAGQHGGGGGLQNPAGQADGGGAQGQHEQGDEPEHYTAQQQEGNDDTNAARFPNPKAMAWLVAGVFLSFSGVLAAPMFDLSSAGFLVANLQIFDGEIEEYRGSALAMTSSTMDAVSATTSSTVDAASAATSSAASATASSAGDAVSATTSGAADAAQATTSAVRRGRGLGRDLGRHVHDLGHDLGRCLSIDAEELPTLRSENIILQTENANLQTATKKLEEELAAATAKLDEERAAAAANVSAKSNAVLGLIC